MNLKPCPCGKTPDTLLIADNGVKWAYAFGDCCNEWHIEFRTAYNPIDSNECMALAITAWNLANRNAAEQSVHLTAFGVGWRCHFFSMLSCWRWFLQSSAAGNANRWADCSTERYNMVEEYEKQFELWFARWSMQTNRLDIMSVAKQAFLAGFVAAQQSVQSDEVPHCTCKAGTGGHASWCELEKYWVALRR